MNATEPTRLQSRSAVHGLVSTSTAAIVRGVGTLLVLAILARYVSKTDFGLVTATLVVIGLGQHLAEALVRPALVQRDNITPRDIGTAASLSWLFGFIAVALFWQSADAIAHLFSEPSIVPIVKVMALVFLLQSPLFVAEGLVQRDFGYGRLAASEVLSFLLGYTVVGVTLALLGAGVWALVWAYVAQILVKMVYLIWHRPDSLRLAFDPASARATLRLAGGFGSSKLLNYAALKGDYAVVAATMNAAAVGVYGRAYQIVSLPVTLMGLALDRVLFPIYARLQNNRPRAAEHYSHSVALSAILIAPATMLFVVLAPEIVRLILGPDWPETIVPLQILAATLLFRMGYKLNDPLTKGLGVVYRRAWRVAVYAAAVIGGAFIGAPWGLAGVSIGVSVAIIINFLLVAQLSLGLLRLSWRDYAGMHARGVVLAVCMLPLAWGAATGLRYLDAGYFSILCAVFALVGTSWLVAAALRPDLVLGPDVQWLTRLIGTAMVPAEASHPRKPLQQGMVVEFLGTAALNIELSVALRAQLAAQQIPVNDRLQANNSRFSRLCSAIEALLRAPRMAFYQAFIIFSSVRQEGSNAVKRIVAWLALSQHVSAAHALQAVSIYQHGVLQELLSLDRQGDFGSIVRHMHQELDQHVPDVLVVLQDAAGVAAQTQAILDKLRGRHRGSSMSIMLFEHADMEKNVTVCAQQIAAEVASQWHTQRNNH
ncbi:MAG: lipopolysaccharide biosynthesis protein [Pseudomonadales bacterium]